MPRNVFYRCMFSAFVIIFILIRHDFSCRFKWGPNFFEMNNETIEAYSKCTNSSEVVKCQTEMLARLDQEIEENRTRTTDLPPQFSVSIHIFLAKVIYCP
jgi:hypothetical protein